MSLYRAGGGVVLQLLGLAENNDISNLPSLEPQQNISSGSYAPYRATLYYLDAQRNTLSTEIREIELATATPKRYRF